MDEQFSVSMESPQSGWMSLRLRAGGRQFVAAVGHGPYDSLRDLLGALKSLLEGRGAGVVRWNAEPEEFDFVFGEEAGRIRLRVVRYPDHRREPSSSTEVFSCSPAREELCETFLNELLDLRARAGTDAFEQNWRRPFPEREFKELILLPKSF